jgi:threonine/homoserine/homoserine lactone efflux protein
MQIFLSLLALMGVHMLAVASPGPGFISVIQTAVRNPRRIMFMHVFGLGLASAVWACSAIFGLQAIMAKMAGLYRAMQLAGGLYLMWIGFKSWRYANVPLPPPAGGGTELTVPQAIWRGFSTNIANPKVMVFYISIFTAVLRPNMPGWVRALAVCITIFDNMALYGTLGSLIGTPKAQACYLRMKSRIDRAAGTVMLGFGAKLVWSARRA